jgi:hypothetical protein
MHNKLKEFEELLLDNILFKVHNRALGIKIPNGNSGGRQCGNSQKNKSK